MIIAQVFFFFFPFFFWCGHKRKDLQVQEEHSSIMLSLLKGELCSLLSQYSIPVAYGARARWKGGVPPHGDPTQTSAWQRPRPFHWDKTQACSVRYHYKWFLCLIGNSCCALLPAGRCWKSVGLRMKLKVGLNVSTHPAFSQLTLPSVSPYQPLPTSPSPYHRLQEGMKVEAQQRCVIKSYYSSNDAD